MSTDDKNDGTKTGSEDEGLPDFIETDDASDDAAPQAAATDDDAAAAAPEPDTSDENDDDSAAAASETDASDDDDDDSEESVADVQPFGAHSVSRLKGRLKDHGDPVVWIKPDADGIFEGEPVDEAELAAWEPEAAYGGTKRNMIALGVMSVAVVAILAHLLLIATSESRSQEVQAFMDGNILEHKTAEVLRLKKQWRDEDVRARNIYGDVSLMYFPADAQVKVTQVTYLQAGESWRKEQADRKEVGRRDMPNDTAKLTEGQTIERLPLLNLPIFEAEKGEDGSVNKVFFYEYELEFDRDGYHPQKKIWRKDSWQRVGPGNRIIDWSGLDLVPKPETIKENFANAMGDIHCLMKLHEIPTIQAATAHENFEMLLLRNRLKTVADFTAAQEVLTRGEHAEWWKTKQDEIAKRDCGPAEEKKK